MEQVSRLLTPLAGIRIMRPLPLTGLLLVSALVAVIYAGTDTQPVSASSNIQDWSAKLTVHQLGSTDGERLGCDNTHSDSTKHCSAALTGDDLVIDGTDYSITRMYYEPGEIDDPLYPGQRTEENVFVTFNSSLPDSLRGTGLCVGDAADPLTFSVTAGRFNIGAGNSTMHWSGAGHLPFSAGRTIPLRLSQRELCSREAAAPQPERPRAVSPTPTPEPSDNADLRRLALETADGTPIDLSPSFSSSQDRYTASVPHDVDSATVMAKADDSDAEIEVEGDEVRSGRSSAPIQLRVDENRIRIRVTAEDDTRRTYRVTIMRSPAPAQTLQPATTPEPTVAPSLTPEPTPTPTPTATPTPQPTATPTPTPTATRTPEPTVTLSPTATPMPTPLTSPTPTPTATPTPAPTATSTPAPPPEPTAAPALSASDESDGLPAWVFALGILLAIAALIALIVRRRRSIQEFIISLVALITLIVSRRH